MTSTHARTPASFAAFAAAPFSSRIAAMAPSSTGPGAFCCLPAVVMIPVPIGFVSTSESPGRAPALVICSPGPIRPVTAMPYFGSLSSTVCPPTTSIPASTALDAPPLRMRPRISLGSSTGKPTMFRANSGWPPIA